jgi:hypothetical protein
MLGALIGGIGKLSAKALKRKPGGTKAGNALRRIFNKKTNGAFGNGVMKQHEAETDQQYKDRMAQAAGAAGQAFQNTAANTQGRTGRDTEAGVKAGFITGMLGENAKKFGIAALALAAVVWVGKKVFGRGASKVKYN